MIAEIETDKATMEVEAVDEGVVEALLVPEGTEEVKVNTPIARLKGEGESSPVGGGGPRSGGGGTPPQLEAPSCVEDAPIPEPANLPAVTADTPTPAPAPREGSARPPMETAFSLPPLRAASPRMLASTWRG